MNQNNKLCAEKSQQTPQRIEYISVVIVVRNAERTIEECLQALSCFKEVIVCDTGSSDSTMKLVRGHENVRLFEIEFTGFGSVKKIAISKASNDWVFSLDSDEILDKKLISAIGSWNLKGEPYRQGVVKFENYFLGKHVKYGDLRKTYIPRLFDRREHEFNNKLVHEGLQKKPQTKRIILDGSIKHLTALDMDTYFLKIFHYTNLSASATRRLSPFMIFCRTIYSFLRSYIWQLGCLEGWRGLVIAWFAANNTFFKYMKAYISNVRK